LEQARAEIRNLRKIARDFQNQLREEMAKKHADAAPGAKKREAVLDRGEQIKASSNYVPRVVPKGSNIKDLLMKVVTTNILFTSYSSDEQAAIVDAFDRKSVGSQTFVIKQGEAGDNFYVVESGLLEIYVKSKDGEQRVGNTLGPGSSFGELALMYNTPRAASIKATSDCVLWEIDRASYRGILVYFKFLRNKQYMEFLRNVEIMEKKLGAIMNESKYSPPLS
jgi:cAMP-dependent protein kinase regulator